MTNAPAPSYAEGQRRLLAAASRVDNPEIREVLNAADVDVLQWFLKLVDYQTAEPPYWIAPSPEADEITAWQRRLRGLTAAVLQEKKQAA